MTTYDFYSPIHKGLRLEMARLLTRLGSVDPHDAAETQLVLAELGTYLNMAASHLNDEDLVIHPALERRSPVSTAQIAANHKHHRPDFAELRSQMTEVVRATDEDRPSVMHHLYLRYSRYMADDLRHLHDEETVTLPVLQTTFSDAELLAMEAEILSIVPLEQLVAFLRLMLPAMNLAEKINFMSALRANAPQDVYFAIVEGTAKPVLGKRAWNEMSDRLAA